ncbi:MAG TPA: SDR family NAD(P)-dependent oxidoreductase [Planctomycetota bacterium]|nr:SDR family NAD(P)-dependent oxidoreductase [Planctomycetota bacterium]
MRTALVTGANRGIGLETARALAASGLSVVVTARDRRGGEQAAAEIAFDEPVVVRFELLDVGNEASVLDCAHRLADAGIEIDVLVNNAGVYPEGKLLTPEGRVAMEGALLTNFWGALWCAQEFVPGMVERGYGRVVNVSSGYGSFGEGLEGPAAYCVSKAALNALTVKLAREVEGDVKVNAVCPGWVRTRMGGPGADIAPEDAVDTIVWLATLPPDGPNGGFFRDREPVPW